MDRKSSNPVSDRFTVIAVALMIVLYLAFGRAMASDEQAPSLRMTLPVSEMQPTGAPMVLDAHYAPAALRKAQ